MLRNVIKITKGLLSKYQLFYPIILAILIFISLNYKFLFFFKKKKLQKFSQKCIDNIDFLEQDLGKTHVNFKKNTSKISKLIIISQIDEEINIACKIYNIKKTTKSFAEFSNYNLVNTSLKDINCMIYKWIFHIFLVFPKSAVLIFCKLNGLQLNYFTSILDNNDKKIGNYLFKTFKLKNLSIIEDNIFKIKIFLEDYVKEFNFPEVLFKIENLIEFSGINQDLNKSICRINNENYYTAENKIIADDNKFYGLSLYAFGHMLSFIDYHSRSNSKDIKIVLSPDWISNSCLANYIKIKYNKNCLISNNIFFNCLTNQNFRQDTINSIFEVKNSIYNMSYNEYLNSGKVSPSIDEEIFNYVVKKSKYKKINIESKYICFFNRDENFKKERFDLDSNDRDRTNDINIFIPVLKYFLNLDFKIMIMGSPNSKKINFQHPNLIEYSHSEYKSDVNDLLLSKDCEFFINAGASSNQFLPPLFRKHSLNLEYPFNRKPIFHDLAYYLIRPYSKSNKIISYKEYFENELFSNQDFRMLEKIDYKLKNNTKTTLLEASESFYKVLNNQENNFVKKTIKKGNINYYYNIYPNIPL
jgi:putative glycosyltransferase (TIGR04372 family)